MPTYDFDKLTLRRNTNSVKWDEATDAQVIPLWVADMDLKQLHVSQRLFSNELHMAFSVTR